MNMDKNNFLKIEHPLVQYPNQGMSSTLFLFLPFHSQLKNGMILLLFSPKTAISYGYICTFSPKTTSVIYITT